MSSSNTYNETIQSSAKIAGPAPERLKEVIMTIQKRRASPAKMAAMQFASLSFPQMREAIKMIDEIWNAQ